jgi:hypothetical protein
MPVVKMHHSVVKMPLSEATRLRTQVAALKKQRRGLKMRLSHLQNRCSGLIDYLDDYIVPKLKTTRKKQCEEAIEPVRNLL